MNILIPLFAVAISLEVAREIFFKLGSRRSFIIDDARGGYMRKIFAAPFIWLGVLLWALEMLVWVRILELCPLNIAFPIMSLCYVGLPLASRIFLKEKLSLKKFLAMAMITFGVVLVGLSG